MGEASPTIMFSVSAPETGLQARITVGLSQRRILQVATCLSHTLLSKPTSNISLGIFQ